jgi:hypothetical protein
MAPAVRMKSVVVALVTLHYFRWDTPTGVDLDALSLGPLPNRLRVDLV